MQARSPVAFPLTVKRVERFAVTDDGQRVVVVELVVELVRVGVVVAGLGGAGAVVWGVMLLTGVVGVAALRTGCGWGEEVSSECRGNGAVMERRLWARLTSRGPEECGGGGGAGCRRCASCRPWSSACPPPPTATSADTRGIAVNHGEAVFRRPCLSFFPLPRFCGSPTAASPCCRWSLIFWAAGCWGLPSAGSSRTRPSSCWARLWKRHTQRLGCLYWCYILHGCRSKLIA